MEEKLFESLPMHIAKKAIPSFDPKTGKTDSVPGIKLEAFIFDVFDRAEKSSVLEVLREVSFFCLVLFVFFDGKTPKKISRKSSQLRFFSTMFFQQCRMNLLL